ncbi:hypothetical protein ABZ281_44295, partial [Streptomyces sp. NPDC006265]
ARPFGKPIALPEPFAFDLDTADLLAERRRRAAPLGTGRPAELPLSAHLKLLRQAGFGTAGPVWQYGDSCVVVAVR